MQVDKSLEVFKLVHKLVGAFDNILFFFFVNVNLERERERVNMFLFLCLLKKHKPQGVVRDEYFVAFEVTQITQITFVEQKCMIIRLH